MHAAMKEAAEKVRPMTVVAGARETQARSTPLFHILVLIVKGRALDMLSSLGERDGRNGCDAYRQNMAAYERKCTTRSIGLLLKELHPV